MVCVYARVLVRMHCVRTACAPHAACAPHDHLVTATPSQAYLREYAFPSCDPFEELLLGPAYATTAVLKASGLKLSDMDVIEFHEAFAGQARP